MKLIEKLNSDIQHLNRTEEIAYLESSLQKAIAESTDFFLMAKFSLDLAAVQIKTMQPEALKLAKKLIDQANSYIQQGGNEGESAFNYLLGKLHYVQALWSFEMAIWDDGLRHLQVALDIQPEVKEQVLIYVLMGKFFERGHNLAEARINFEKALSIALDVNAASLTGMSCANLANWHLTTGNSVEARSLYQNALDIAMTEGDYELKSLCLRGLARVAIAQSRWQDAITMIEDAIAQLQEPVDTLDIGYLYCDLTEALLGDRQLERSLFCARVNLFPRFRELHFHRGLAIARYLRGKIYTQRIQEGLEPLDEDAIETAEDSLLDASLAFEQQGMTLDYATSLYELAKLYQLSLGSQYHYQYQGKALRSLELALSILDQLGMSDHQLTQRVDKMLTKLMQG
ncbi:MAG: tetratricopeptide repeat protein [Pseudanabaenaceae cyanobacterium bins.39]|nr:tetratricopeptide repeat protein [Pseudanabaenaceae cyanobacterium bins.39]